MRKITIILLALFFVSGILAVSFAASTQGAPAKPAEAKNDIFRGKIVSLDTSKNEIVVKDKTGVEKAIAVAPKDIANLKMDDMVKVTFKEGSNVALGVKKIIKKPGMNKKPGR